MPQFSRRFKISNDIHETKAMLALLDTISKGLHASKATYSYTIEVPDSKKPGEYKKQKITYTHPPYSSTEGYFFDPGESLSDFWVYYYACKVLKSTYCDSKLFKSDDDVDLSIPWSVVCDVLDLPEEERIKGEILDTDTENVRAHKAKMGLLYVDIPSAKVMELLRYQNILIDINRNVLNIIKGMSSCPVKFSGSWLNSGDSEELRVDYLQDNEDIADTINSSIVSEIPSKMASVGFAKMIAWSSMLNLPVQVGDFYCRLGETASLEMSFGNHPLFRSDKKTLAVFSDEINKLDKQVIPDKVVSGLCMLMVPDGDGDFISLTPTPRFQVMQEINIRATALKEDRSFRREHEIPVAISDDDIYFRCLQRAIVDNKELNNGYGNNQWMKRVWQQSPDFPPKKSFSERKAWVIAEKAKEGKLSIADLAQKAGKQQLASWFSVFNNSKSHRKAIEAISKALMYYVRNDIIKNINANLNSDLVWKNKDLTLYKWWLSQNGVGSSNANLNSDMAGVITRYIIRQIEEEFDVDVTQSAEYKMYISIYDGLEKLSGKKG